MEGSMQVWVLILAAVLMLSLIQSGSAELCMKGLKDGSAVHLTPNCSTLYPAVLYNADDSNNELGTVTIEYICTNNSGYVVAADVIRNGVMASPSIISLSQSFTTGTLCTFTGCYVSVNISSYTEASYAIKPSSCIVEIDECQRNTDICNVNAECINAEGSYTCVCNSGYSGDGFTCTRSECVVVIINTSGAVAAMATFMVFLIPAVLICIVVAKVRIKRSQDVPEINMGFFDKIDPDYEPVQINETVIDAESMQSIFDKLEVEDQENNHPNDDQDSSSVEIEMPDPADVETLFEEASAQARDILMTSESGAIPKGYVVETSANMDSPISTVNDYRTTVTDEKDVEVPGQDVERVGDDILERACHISTYLKEGDSPMKRRLSIDSNFEFSSRTSDSDNEHHTKKISCNGYHHTHELTDFGISATPSIESEGCTSKSSESHLTVIGLPLSQPQNENVLLLYEAVPSDLQNDDIDSTEKKIAKQPPTYQPLPTMMHDISYVHYDEFLKEQTQSSSEESSGQNPKMPCTRHIDFDTNIDGSKYLSCNTENT